jgi:uncharacterized delta-60 repeat protein
VVAGTTDAVPGGAAYALARYLPDGRLDPSFGPDHTGKVIVPIGPANRPANSLLALAPDGRLVLAAGPAPDASFAGPTEILIIRLNADGTPDEDFGTQGRARTNLCGDHGSYPRGVTVAPDGKVLVIAKGCDESYLVRFLANGDLDPAFGSEGVAVASPFVSFSHVHVAPDGTITVGGHSFSSGFDGNAIARFAADGTPDPTYGTGGLAGFPGGNNVMGGMVVLDDGRVVAVGTMGDRLQDQDVVVARFAPDGTLDPTFGQGGVVINPDLGGAENAHGVAVRPDGSIVVVGEFLHHGLDTGLIEVDALLLGYDASGHLDPSFGTNGVVRTDFGGKIAGAKAVVLGPDGSLTTAGSWRAERFGVESFTLARYLPDGRLDPTFNGQCPWQ